MIYAILDTNVVVSAMLKKLRLDTATSKTLEYIFLGKVIPVYNDQIIAEYTKVLN